MQCKINFLHYHNCKMTKARPAPVKGRDRAPPLTPLRNQAADFTSIFLAWAGVTSADSTVRASWADVT